MYSLQLFKQDYLDSSDVEFGRNTPKTFLESIQSIEFTQELITALSKLQIVFCGLALIGAFLILSEPVDFAFQVYIAARILALVIVGFGCKRLTDNPADPWTTRPAQTLIALYLQFLWFFSEVLLGTNPSFAVLAKTTKFSFAAPWLTTLITSPIPACTMVGFAGIKTYLARIKRRRRSSAFSSPDASPIDSQSSRSSNGVYSGESSPVGHCNTPRLRAHHASTTTGNKKLEQGVYLEQHIVETHGGSPEPIMFVHKKLSPIKTRPTPPGHKAGYVPLLAPLLSNDGALLAKHVGKDQPAQPPVKGPGVHAHVTLIPGKAQPIAIPHGHRNHVTAHVQVVA